MILSRSPRLLCNSIHLSSLHNSNSSFHPQIIHSKLRPQFRSFSETQTTRSTDDSSRDRYVFTPIPDIPLFQKLSLKFGASLGSIPSKCSSYCENESPLFRLSAEMNQDHVGAQILQRRLVISRKAEYQNYPPNSLGKILSSNLPLSSDQQDKDIHFGSELSYTFSRYAQAHHCLKALFKFPATELSEVALRWFEFVQTGLTAQEFTRLFGSLEVSSHDQTKLKDQILPWALAHARNPESQISYITTLRSFKLISLNPHASMDPAPSNQPAFFLNIKWEDHMKEDVDQLVQKFGYTRPNF